MRKLQATVLAIAVLTIAYLPGPFAAERQPAASKVFTSPGGTQLRVLVDAKSLGGTEVEMAELTFAPNSDSGDHRHAVTETFYVLEGDMEQVVNGTPIKLSAGMVASIRSTDQVRHKTGPKGAKVLVIWAPGGEIDRVTAKWKASGQ
jgi:quercetin dioxygenase-like cupin family protein